MAVFFNSDPNLVFIGIAGLGVAVFGLLGRFLGSRFRLLVISGMVIVGLVTWSLDYLSGIHATIAGVTLGLAMARIPGMRTRHALEPISNGVVLSLFAFSAALVAIPQIALSQIAAPFWGILVALPVGRVDGVDRCLGDPRLAPRRVSPSAARTTGTRDREPWG